MLNVWYGCEEIKFLRLEIKAPVEQDVTWVYGNHAILILDNFVALQNIMEWKAEFVNTCLLSACAHHIFCLIAVVYFPSPSTACCQKSSSHDSRSPSILSSSPSFNFVLKPFIFVHNTDGIYLAASHAKRIPKSKWLLGSATGEKEASLHTCWKKPPCIQVRRSPSK